MPDVNLTSAKSGEPSTSPHTPATPLPWHVEQEYFSIADVAGGFAVCDSDMSLTPADWVANSSYIVHAANAYPKLVAKLRLAEEWFRPGTASGGYPPNNALGQYYADLTALLRELGELP